MLYLPDTLPAVSAFDVQTYSLPKWREVQDLTRLWLLNLMPEKERTELDFVRTIFNTGLDIQLIPVKFKGRTYKTTSQQHMECCYLDFEDVVGEPPELLIVTGAPLEQIPFEDVDYWPQLCRLMDWADDHVQKVLFICWGAQAALYHHYGIQKEPLSDKCFGIFEQQVLAPESSCMRHLSPSFPMPNSRHTEVRREAVLQHADEGLRIVAESEESGIGIVGTIDDRRLYVIGHLEYAADTLQREYLRDKSKGLAIKEPLHYYDTDGHIAFTWQNAAITFYRNWMSR